MDLHPAVRSLFAAQHHVASRAQLIGLGLVDNDLRRLVRHRQLVVVHRGVYADHTGALSWSSRSMAAVLFHPHSALCHTSALELSGDPIHVAIEHPRRGAPLAGVRLHRVRHLEERVQWHRNPPRLRIEEAALDVAGVASSTSDAVAVLAGVVQRRETTAERLLERLAARARTPRGSELREIIGDVASGHHSVLERLLLTRVLRPHGLPLGSAQSRASGGAGHTVWRDRLYEDLGLAIELDGRAWHDSAEAREDDGWRDLDAAGDGVLTLRLGWPHAEKHPCRTALGLGTVMRQRGWDGRPTSCAPSCTVGSIAGTP